MNEKIDVHQIFTEYFKGIEPLAYAVSKSLEAGSICLDKDKFGSIMTTIGEEGPDTLYYRDPKEFDQLIVEGTYVTHKEDELKPFVYHNGKVYLQRYFHYENKILEKIAHLGNNFRIVTGGPGSGKTYGVAVELVQLFKDRPDIKVALAAPTGKAAARMKESIKKFANDPDNKLDKNISEKLAGLETKTIHRLLGYIQDSVFFRYDEKNPLPYDVFIIDEASMIDGALMAKLLNAVPPERKLWLVGDKDQLASVEAGSVFGDLCRSKDTALLKDKVEVKTKSWRFDPDKGIGKFSRAVIAGQTTEVQNFKTDEQMETDYSFSNENFETFADKYTAYITEPDTAEALKKLNKVRFLCAVREGEQGIYEMNKRIERYLKKKLGDETVFQPKSSGFYHNQPIIVTKNNYDLNIFNGDVGLIRREGNVLYAWFEKDDGGIRNIPPGYLNDYETVFAMTVHKSQGSEFDHVMVVLPEHQAGKLLTRELLYTAVTRAKTKALVQCTEETLMACVETGVNRASGIYERLISE